MGVCDGFTPTGGPAAERAWMDTVEDRLEQMETQQRLFNSSIRGGALVVYDENLMQVGRLGVNTYPIPGGGLRTAPLFTVNHPTDGQHIVIDTEDGFVAPLFQYNWVSTAPVVITTAGFNSAYKSNMNVHGYGLLVRFRVDTDPGTTATVRLVFGLTPSGEISVPADSDTFVEFHWDITDIAIFNSFASLTTECKRDTGTGDVRMNPPDIGTTFSLKMLPTATADGVPA